MQAKMFSRLAAAALTLLFLTVVRTTAQNAPVTTPSPYKPTLIIDIMAMDGESRAAIIKGIGELSNKSTWQPVTIRGNENLYQIIDKTYGFSDKKYRLTALAIADLIKGFNRITNINSLKEGQQLFIPPLGVRPYSMGAEPHIAQFLALHKGDTFAAFMAEPVEGSASLTNDLARGSTWIPTDLSAADIKKFLESLPPNVVEKVVGKSLYVGPSENDVAEITLLNSVQTPAGTNTPPAAPTPQPANLSALLGGIPEDKIGKYYILDVFGSSSQPGCTHGDLVYQVAVDTLRQHGAPASFENRLVKIELDFFNHKDTAKKYIEEYAGSFNQNIEIQILGILDRLLNKKFQGDDKTRVPLLYLSAINYKLLRDPNANASVISSSFWTLFDGFSWLPPEYTTKSPAILLSAVMNDKESTIENPTYIRTEPIRTFHDKRDEYGVILVGAEVDAGTFAGMSSETGDGVTCLGKGAGWGPSGSCLNKERGTSLATPNIAAEMFLAKAFWAANKLDVSQQEARIRLLLASDVVPSYIDKFASAGVPRLEKLLRLKGAYAVTSGGIAVEVRVEPGASLKFVKNGSPRPLFFERDPDNSGFNSSFCGLQLVDGQAFVFSEAARKWVRLDVTELSMKVTVDGEMKEFRSLKDFSSQLKEIVVL